MARKDTAYLSKKPKNVFDRIKTIQLFVLALPAILNIFIFSYIPMAGIIIAFKKIDFSLGIFRSQWAGLNNFKFFFTSSDAWLVIRNTLGYNIANIFVGTAISVIFAIFLFEVTSRKTTKFYQTVFFFPYFFSWVIVSYMSIAFLGGKPMGILVSVLNSIGINATRFYLTPFLWPPYLVFLSIWKGLGYTSVVFYAAILGLPSDCFEAAKIDGATRLQIIRYITLPLIVPVISIMTLLAVGKIFYSDFGLYYFIPNQIAALIPITQTIDTYVYRALTQTSNISMAAASGFFQSVFGFIVVLMCNLIVRKINPENSIF